VAAGGPAGAEEAAPPARGDEPPAAAAPDRELVRFYANYDERHRLDWPATAAELRAAYQARGPLYDLRVRELSSMIALDGARVLDVGFGRGHFMWSVQALGADVYGIELDDAAIALAPALGFAHVRKATIEECANDRPYDVIALNDVIEHPLRPIDVLRACATLLSPGGLMLIWTPNGAAARGAEAPVTFRVDLEHMQYLTPQTCSLLAGVLGLHIAHLETYGFPSLGSFDRMRPPGPRTRAVRQAARSVPQLAKTVHRLKEWTTQWGARDERLGVYHLFCIYQKSDRGA
jgi:2-polyprenyl-3-methyl-5-hydroxy-6-metoxy-1,4-benzoquinol methylase